MKKIFGFDSTFANFMNAFGSVILLGLLWLLSSLPIITMGAASCAAYDVTVNVIRKGRGYVISSFFDSFRCNFRVSLPVQVIYTFVMAFLAFDCIYLYGYGTEFSQMLSYILYAFVIIFFMLILYIYPIMQRFDESRFVIFKLAFYMTFRHLFTSLILVALTIVCIAGIYYMPWAIMIIPGIWWFIQSIFIEHILSKLSVAESDEENDVLESDSDKDDNMMQEDSTNAIRNSKKTKSKRRRLKKFFKKKTDGESLIAIENVSSKPVPKDDPLKDRVVKKD